MNSMGVFREGEIDGKPFHIFNFLPQIDSPFFSLSSSSSLGEVAIDCGGDDLSEPQPLFLCPSSRLKIETHKREKYGFHSEDGVLPFNVSPHFLKVGSTVQDICKLPVSPLFWCNNKEPRRNEFECGVCLSPKIGTDYYLCVTCGKKFHKECVEPPLEIKHPFYPFLSLQLYTTPSSTYNTWRCVCCGWYIYYMVYYCPTYNVRMHIFCALMPIPIFLNHSKCHLHPLNFFPKQDSLSCDVCGMIKKLIPTYICARCVFVVHNDCIYFPHVIRISRHQHRVSFTSSLPSGKWSCGVCRQKVDYNCGAYSCNKCSDYFVHTRCALRKDLWDGKDLEGVPEEPEIVVEPFEKIADGVILHFSHVHHLKRETSGFYDEHKFCQACTLPIYEGRYYSCTDECDFILHEICANSPMKKHNPLHAHPLTLQVVTNEYFAAEKGYFQCSACECKSCSFVYTGCYGFKLDLQCASVSEPFEYQGHEHPLFLALTPEEEASAICQICQKDSDGKKFRRKLNCIEFECNFVICFKCATLPYKARYKHDKHFLTFYQDKEANEHSDWCDICERKIGDLPKEGFYSCDDCCTTLHIGCLLGKDPYMKPGQTITYGFTEIRILRNNTLSRPFCRRCKHRCPGKTVFKQSIETFCSFDCLVKLEMASSSAAFSFFS